MSEVAAMGWVVERPVRGGRSRFTAAYRDRGGRIRSAGTFSTRREAERAAGRQDYKVSDGSWIDPAGGRIGFHAYAMDVWLPSRHLEVTTRAGYLSYLRNHFVPYFGSTPLSDITPSMVQHWVRPVSYTHLRAHETRHDLVCRLLLEKKKKKKNKNTKNQN